MKSLSGRLFAFSGAFLVLLMAPAFLKGASWFHPHMGWGDALDLLTPIVLLPLYWLLFHAPGDDAPPTSWTVWFLVLGAMWVEGQGMHLAANSIGHLLKAAPRADVTNLTHYYDEVLSHYLWHAGVIGLAALLLLRDLQRDVGARILPSVYMSALLYGFTYFVIIIEGATTSLGVPAAAALGVGGYVRGRGALRAKPQTLFWVTAHGVALLLFLGWGLYWQGLPEFSAVGIID